MLDTGHGCDGVPHGSHSLEESVLHLVGGDDGPASPVIQHLFVGLLGAGRGLEENNLESIICWDLRMEQTGSLSDDDQ